MDLISTEAAHSSIVSTCGSTCCFAVILSAAKDPEEFHQPNRSQLSTHIRFELPF
jgi:hypothetical protein